MPAGSSHGPSIPGADRKEKRAASAHTFEVVARQWLKLLQPRVAKGQLTADTVKDATRILERDIFPALGTRSFSDIKAHELLMVLQATLQPRISTRHRPGLCRAGHHGRSA